MYGMQISPIAPTVGAGAKNLPVHFCLVNEQNPCSRKGLFFIIYKENS